MRRVLLGVFAGAALAACFNLDGFSTNAPAEHDGGAAVVPDSSSGAPREAGPPPPDGGIVNGLPDAGGPTCGSPGPVDGLAVYYPFDETSGTTLHDCSGHGLDGIFVRAAAGGNFTPGKIGGAIVVTQQPTRTGCVDLDPSSIIEPAEMSIAVWLEVNQFPTAPATGYIVGQSLNAGYGGWRIGSLTSSSDAGAVGWQHANTDGSAGAVLSEVWPTDGAWHHLVVTLNATTLAYYIDGVARGTTTPASPITYSTTVPFRVGCRADDENYFDGAIDELRMYSRVLTTGEIQTLASGH